MNILRLFEDFDALSLNEILELTGSPKTTVLRMISSLQEMGFLSKRKDRKYMLGLSLLHYGQLVVQRLDYRKIALPMMYELRDKINEAVNLAIPDGEEVMYVEKVDTSQMVRVYVQVGRRAPYYAGADPRILLAFMEENKLNSYLETVKLTKIASRTITDKETLRKVLESCKQLGYSISFSELEDGAAAIAAPIYNHTGNVVAALSITGPDHRFQKHEEYGLIPLVIQTAARISEALGYNGSRELEV